MHGDLPSHIYTDAGRVLKGSHMPRVSQELRSSDSLIDRSLEKSRQRNTTPWFIILGYTDRGAEARA